MPEEKKKEEKPVKEGQPVAAEAGKPAALGAPPGAVPGAPATKSKKGRNVKKKPKVKRKGKKHSSPQIWKKYQVKGTSIENKNRFCPRCGPGTRLAQHKTRSYCGKCAYTETKS